MTKLDLLFPAVTCVWPLSGYQPPFQAKHMSKAKADDKMEGVSGDSGGPIKMFHDYDLDALNLPMEARPFEGQTHLGKHGYTIRDKHSGAVS